MGPERLVGVIERHLELGVVGVAIAVVRGDEVAWSGGFGKLDIERDDPVTTQSRFPIQSVTKTLVATALMPWIERGAVGLDDPVNQHLAPVAIGNEWEASSPITIRQLLTHTAGLPVSVGWGASDSLEALVAGMKTEAEPGTRMVYANWGYDALGYLIERLAGDSWETATRDAVTGPLAMTATSTDKRAPDAQSPTGYAVSQLDGSHLRMDPPPWSFASGPPSGALVSTVEDLARFLLAHLNDQVPGLTAETFASMRRLHAPLGNGGGGMGLGFRVDRRGGRAFFGHGGDGDGCTTFIGGHAAERVGVALLMNTGGAQNARSEIVRAALEWALGDDAASATADDDALVRPTDGGYRSTYWGIRAELANGSVEPVLVTAPGAIAMSVGVSRLFPVDGRWRADGGMFDGCELDFDGDGSTFVGGLYPLQFAADPEPVVGLPTTVDENGVLTGAWNGTTDTPIGPIPLALGVDPAGVVTIDVMGTNAADANAETHGGWLRAALELEVIGFGAIAVHPRLGLVQRRLEGLLYIRTVGGEIVCPTVLDRD